MNSNIMLMRRCLILIMTMGIVVSVQAQAIVKNEKNDVIPIPTAFVANKSFGHISKVELVLQIGVGAAFRDTVIDAPCMVTQFNYIIVSDNKIIAQGFIKGNKFDEEYKRQIQQVRAGDKIGYFNIECNCSGVPKIRLKPIELIID